MVDSINRQYSLDSTSSISEESNNEKYHDLLFP